MDVKTLCLGVLSVGPASGYEIRKAFESGPFSHFQEAAFASIYPALKTLAADGLIVGTEEKQDSRPDRRVYTITATGRTALFAALSRPPGPDKIRSDFMFVLFFAQLLPPERVDALIAERLRALSATIAALEACADRPREPGHRFVYGLGLEIYRTEHAYLDAHRADLVAAAARRRDSALAAD